MSRYLPGTSTTTSNRIGPIRCAIYARYSSDNQKDTSIVDQIRNCRELAARNGWVILEDHIYVDEEKSGTTVYGRDGLADLMAAAEAKPKPFDYVLSDNTSRFGRNKAECLKNADIIRFLRIGMYFVQGNLDSAHSSFDSVYHQRVYSDQEYSESIGHNTRKGLRGQFLAGFHTGQACFGYRNQPIEDPTRKGDYGRPAIAGVKQIIDPEEAKIIVWIFEAYVAGMSYTALAKALNQRSVPTVMGTHGKRQTQWCKSAVREMLGNRRYLGETTWGRTRKERDPRNGKIVTDHLPEERWERMTLPELRIISDELFDQVQQQKKTRTARFRVQGLGGMARTEASRKYLLSGLLRCGHCAGNMSIVTNNPARYGCAGRREGKTCPNKMTVIQTELERHLLSNLTEHLRSEEFRDDLAQSVFQQIKSKSLAAASRRGQADRDREQIQADRKVVAAELENVLAAIRAGMPPKVLVDEAARLEAKQAHLDELLSETLTTTPAREITEEEVRSFLEKAIGQVHEIMSGAAETVKAELQKRVSSIVLTPSMDPTGPLYTITGDVALFSCNNVAVQGNQPPLDALHYNVPIAIEIRSHRKRGRRAIHEHPDSRLAGEEPYNLKMSPSNPDRVSGEGFETHRGVAPRAENGDAFKARAA